MVDMVTETINR